MRAAARWNGGSESRRFAVWRRGLQAARSCATIKERRAAAGAAARFLWVGVWMMYQDEYVSLYRGGGFWINNAECKQRKIIDRYAAQRWRYAGCLPIKLSGDSGLMKEADLVLGRPVEDEK